MPYFGRAMLGSLASVTISPSEAESITYAALSSTGSVFNHSFACSSAFATLFSSSGLRLSILCNFVLKRLKKLFSFKENIGSFVCLKPSNIAFLKVFELFLFAITLLIASFIFLSFLAVLCEAANALFILSK